MELVDKSIIEGFRIEITQQLAESVEFAVQALINDGERDPEELRQVAQDALMELMMPIPEAVVDAYQKSPLHQADFEAIASIFKQLAIRAKLKALCASKTYPQIAVDTRKGAVIGALYDVLEHDGMESAHIGDEFVPLISIEELHVSS